MPWLKGFISNDEGLRITPLDKEPSMTATFPEISKFFTSPAFAVVGASSDEKKFGNKVLRCYLKHHKKVYPINPHEETIAGITCVKQLADLPNTVKSISIVTPPPVTETIVDQAIAFGIENIWMQPGAESDLAIEKCEQHGINVIAGGPCILQELGCH